MFGAIWRYFRALGYLVTGRLDAARKVLDTNPHVVRATFDHIVRDKKGRVNHYKEAVATLIAQKEKKVQKVKNLTEDVQKLERLKTGAMAKAKQRVAELQAAGKSIEEIQHDEDYVRCQSAFQDFRTTLAEKQARITELEAEIEDGTARIGEHKVQLQHLLREIEKVKEEAADTVADMITAKEEKEVADLLTGLSEDRSSLELARMRELRLEVKAEAQISKELAGTDTRAQEAEFLDYARTHESQDEFAALVGLAEEEDTAGREAPEKDADAPLPE